MSYHIPFNHACPKCGAYYIPFDQAVPCPKCGEVERGRFDFISEASISAKINFKEGGQYTPIAWWVGSLGDHILYIVFGLLEQHRRDATGRAFSDLAARSLAGMEWGDQFYLRDHIRAIACRVRQQLDAESANSDATENRAVGPAHEKPEQEEKPWLLTILLVMVVLFIFWRVCFYFFVEY